MLLEMCHKQSAPHYSSGCIWSCSLAFPGTTYAQTEWLATITLSFWTINNAPPPAVLLSLFLEKSMTLGSYALQIKWSRRSQVSVSDVSLSCLFIEI